MSTHIIAEVSFFTASDGGRQGPTPPDFFGCLFQSDSKSLMNDCRLVLSEVGSIHPGQTVEVAISFLHPELATTKLVKGSKFTLWEGKTIARGEVLKIVT